MPPTMEDKVKTGRAKSLARHLPTVARILMGLPFFVSGLNGFLHFLPQPSMVLPEGAAVFADALMRTGYMMPLIFGTQLIVGALLLANRFVPLALALIAPFVVHAFLALEIYLAWTYRKAYRPMLFMRVTPGAE